jgi:hypothetical protein
MNAGGPTATLDDAFALYTVLPTTTCFFDDFASGWGKWTRTSEWDIVTVDGNEAATDSPNSSYRNAGKNATRITTITSQPFSLAECSDPVLSFRHDYAIAIGPSQYQDWGKAEVSVDDGQTWQTLKSYTGGEGYPAAQATADETDEWIYADTNEEAINLARAGVLTNTTTAQLRFSLIVDAVGSDKGWIIDDVVVRPSIAGESRWKVYLPLIAKQTP